MASLRMWGVRFWNMRGLTGIRKPRHSVCAYKFMIRAPSDIPLFRFRLDNTFRPQIEGFQRRRPQRFL